MSSRPVSIRKFLEAEGPLARWLQKARGQQRLLQQVRRLLPDDLAGRCMAAVRDADRLVLFAPSPVWANRLRFAAPAALSALPGVREIRVRVMPPGPVSAPVRPLEAHPRRLSPDSAEAISAAADAVSDPGLSEALQRLAAHVKNDREQ